MEGDAALARRGLPAWADRIWTGNALTWRPPRRFDYVRTELVYVPVLRRADLIHHLLTNVVAPGGLRLPRDRHHHRSRCRGHSPHPRRHHLRPRDRPRRRPRVDRNCRGVGGCRTLLLARPGQSRRDFVRLAPGFNPGKSPAAAPPPASPPRTHGPAGAPGRPPGAAPRSGSRPAAPPG